MANTLSNELLAQLFAQESHDPFLILVTLSHASFSQDITLANNSENIVCRGITFLSFPMRIVLPIDDGGASRNCQIEFDNVSLALISQLRTITNSDIRVKLEMVLASIPNVVQMSLEDFKIGSISYDKIKIQAELVSDNFMDFCLTSERYQPSNFPGIF